MSVVSPDRKTRTVTTIGTNPAGQAVDNLSVYDRQEPIAFVAGVVMRL